MRILFSMLFGWLIVFSACQTPKTPPAMTRVPGFSVHGIDVSHYQNRVNWDSVWASGVQFAFVKATEGETWRDSFFCKNWDKLNEIGLKRGAYHFFYPTLNAKKQAENFLEMVDLQPGDLPPVVDVETAGDVSRAVLIAKLRIWLWMVEEKTGVRPIIYTNLNFYEKWLSGQFEANPLWIARFSGEKPLLIGKKQWDFWQYASHGRLSGVAGSVDFNVFQGDLAELQQLCVQQPQPVSEEKPVVSAASLLPIMRPKKRDVRPAAAP
jgi:lysozyme